MLRPDLVDVYSTVYIDQISSKLFCILDEAFRGPFFRFFAQNQTEKNTEKPAKKVEKRLKKLGKKNAKTTGKKPTTKRGAASLKFDRCLWYCGHHSNLSDAAALFCGFAFGVFFVETALFFWQKKRKLLQKKRRKPCAKTEKTHRKRNV